MRFGEKYPDIIARFDRFWKGEETDRPVMFITCLLYTSDAADE